MRRDADGMPSEEYMMFGPSARVDYGFRDDFVAQEPGVRRAAGDIPRAQSTRPSAMQVAGNYRSVRIKVPSQINAAFSHPDVVVNTGGIWS